MKHIDYDALPDMLGPNQVGVIFGVDAKTVGRWAGAGTVRYIQTPGSGAGPGHRRFPKDQFREVIAKRNGEEAPKA